MALTRRMNEMKSHKLNIDRLQQFRHERVKSREEKAEKKSVLSETVSCICFKAAIGLFTDPNVYSIHSLVESQRLEHKQMENEKQNMPSAMQWSSSLPVLTCFAARTLSKNQFRL